MLCRHLWPDCSRDLILAALGHDLAEHLVGDVPATAKWRWPELKNSVDQAEYRVMREMGLIHEEDLTEKDAQRLKIADMMELLWYCIEEIRLGNMGFREVFHNAEGPLWELFSSDDVNFSREELMLLELQKERDELL